MNKFKTDYCRVFVCAGGTAATAFACRASFRGFESHPALYIIVKIISSENNN